MFSFGAGRTGGGVPHRRQDDELERFRRRQKSEMQLEQIRRRSGDHRLPFLGEFGEKSMALV